ncbi:MAG: hypothetical protein ACTSWL_00760 [Promethearchaeota archaeon]
MKLKLESESKLQLKTLLKKTHVFRLTVLVFVLLNILQPVLCQFDVPNSTNFTIENTVSKPRSAKNLFDSVEFFPAGQSKLDLNLTFEKNRIYYFQVESYSPFSDDFSLNIYANSPTGKMYHFLDYQSQISNNISNLYFEFGSAETGDHLLRYIVLSSANINLHILIEEYSDLESYYKTFSLDISALDNVLISNISCFSSSKRHLEYIIDLKDDNEYHFNFFRVNPINDQDLASYGHTFDPKITMSLLLNGSSYVLYPDLPITNYALYNNLNISLNPAIFLSGGRDFNDPDFLVRFGSQCTGPATISLDFSQFWPVDANFGFMLYSKGNIGDGSDNPEDIAINDTTTTNSTNNTNSTTETNSTVNPPSTNSSDLGFLPKINLWFQNQYSAFVSFCNLNFWSIIMIIGVLVGISYGVIYLKEKRLFHEHDLKENRSNYHRSRL